MKKIVITGGDGLIGLHVRSALHAINCALEFKGSKPQYDIVSIGRNSFLSDSDLLKALDSSSAVIHLAGVNRATPEEVAIGNQRIAKRLVEHLSIAKAKPHVIYSNSTHALGSSDYGLGKKASAAILKTWADEAGGRLTDFILPHIFGEGGRPNYNTVTATLCQHLVDGTKPEIHQGAEVELLHAGEFAEAVIDSIEAGHQGQVRLPGVKISVDDLYRKLSSFKQLYDLHQIPSLEEKLDLQLFNTYRLFEFPNSYPRALKLNSDQRGTLFEAIKGGGGGQTFLSWTEPGIERGNHFHRTKFERFLVVSGQAEIRIRRVFDSEVKRFQVNGEQPSAVDMPTLYTHSIINTGNDPLLTLFWTNEIFDPENPDTYFDEVEKV